jgi:hypothetical protein
MKKEHDNLGKILTIGAGLAALGATTYFFFGPNGKRNQQKLKGWMIKMKGEIIERIEGMKEISEEAYNSIIDAVMETYKDKVESGELQAFADSLKDHWLDIVRDAHAKPKSRRTGTAKSAARRSMRTKRAKRTRSRKNTGK